MTQPSFVPIGESDQMRPSLRLEPPRRWQADRAAEQAYPARPGGRGRGAPGPDQGYALRLARRFESRLHLGAGEHAADAIVGCALLASRRSALFGRAPSVYDVEAAFSLWGFLTDVPADLLDVRRMAFSAVSHDYQVQRRLVDRVPEAVLRQPAAVLARRVAAGAWRELVGETST